MHHYMKIPEWHNKVKTLISIAILRHQIIVCSAAAAVVVVVGFLFDLCHNDCTERTPNKTLTRTVCLNYGRI